MRLLGLLVAGLVGVGALTACSSGADGATDGSSVTAEASDSPEATDTDAASSSPTADDPDDEASDDADGSGDEASDGSGDDDSMRVSRCSTDDLEGELTEGDGGAAGSTLPYIVVTNAGDDPCRLQGWPGVSFVGGDDGTQLGAAATMDRSSPHATVTLKPNGHAHAPLRVANAAHYDKGDCQPEKADGLRVYPPGEKESLFIRESGLTACTDDGVELLEVQAFQPGAA